MEVLSEGHLLAEAPRGLPDDSVLFSDVVAGGVYRVPPGGGPLQTVVERRRGIGGLLPGRGETLIVAGRDLAAIEPGGEPRTLLAPEGATGVNDLSSDGSGGVLAGVLRFRPMAGEDPVPGEVWHVPAGGEQPRVLARDVLWPNGIGISPDGQTLYVSDFAQSLVLRGQLRRGARRVGRGQRVLGNLLRVERAHPVRQARVLLEQELESPFRERVLLLAARDEQTNRQKQQPRAETGEGNHVKGLRS